MTAREKITPEHLAAAAAELGVPLAAVKAVLEVETPTGSFDAQGFPRILFEGHVFHRLTGGKFDKVAPTLSFPRWTREHYAKGKDVDQRNEREHARLQKAVELSRSAALMSASWGGFQIMGENFAAAGFASLQDFINAMYAGEPAHLRAFVEFVQHDRGGRGWKALKSAVATGNWTPFAEFYNGASQHLHDYAGRLASAYRTARGTAAQV
jgi:hypothetical protein